jgi:hypothetical protein
VWQALHEELAPQGLVFVTVGLDAAGPEACRPFIEASAPSDASAPAHLALVDQRHVMAEAFGVFNIPNAIWIDEEGTIVRPPEAAQPRESLPDMRYEPIEGMPDRMNDILAEASKIQVDTGYAAMIRDWAAKGADSELALPPAEVVARSRPRDASMAEGVAHFELGARLWADDDRAGAEEHWRAAHRLDPSNFAYKRQAWSLDAEGVGPFERFWQGPVPGREDDWPYESDWLSEVRAAGAERYYPPIER